ncbi:hypothetical protein ADIS_1104 [Lunatimonas lonarensis]|uniref:Uncharacterized protein n=1 Tax=Lunatimonas lonarensis TaxID=1232681 RepID=R7ZWL1_9BACT|nr:hypothetical protein [Lunatimonas lonarensis]EON78408.1 hypothetical protein ADIS_1104 [Lunatimonas lonarensis]
MCGECVLPEPRLFHGHADGMLYGPVVHGLSRGLSLEEEHFGPVEPVIGLKQWEHGGGQDGEPVPASLPGDDLQLHVGPADVPHLQETEFAEPDARAVEQCDDGPVLEV